jgi:hypothetical protein
MQTTSDITIRLADYQDARALLRLAALDSARVPDGPLLVAETDGELVAAVPLGGGRAIADPFRPTANLVGVLALRAQQLHPDHGKGLARAGLARLPWAGRPRAAAGL